MYTSTNGTGGVADTIKRKGGVSQACLGKSTSFIFDIHNMSIGHSKKCHFQSEAKFEAIDVKMSFNYDANTTHFHNKGFRT